MKNNKDYQDDLKQALSELDEPVRKKEGKKFDFLNVILGVLVVLIIVVGIAGAVIIGKSFVNNNDPSGNNPVVDNNQQDDNNNQDDSNVNTDVDDDNKDEDIDDNQQNDADVDDNQDDTDADENNDQNQSDDSDDTTSEKGFIQVTNEENGDFEIVEFRVSREDEYVRFDINSNTNIAGNVFLMDDKGLSIGPISINEGNNNIYFLVGGYNNYSFHFDASNGREYIYDISSADIKNALDE